MPKLIIQMQSQEWAAELVQGSNVLGRASTCTIPIREASLSRQHCEVVLQGPKAKVVDKGSMNGTLLNGKRVWEQELVPGDRITIGGVHIWFETKGNLPKRPATAATAQAGSTSGVDTRRAAPLSDPTASKVPAPPSKAAVAAEAELGDYTYRGSAGAPILKILTGVVIVGVLAVAIYFGQDLLKSGPASQVDERNVIRYDPTFDSVGRPDNWKIVRGKGTKAAVVADQGVGGSPCLQLDKSRKADDFEAVLGYQTDLPMGRGGQVSAEVSTRFEGFTGWAGLRIEWLQRARGAVIAEEYSDLVGDAAAWSTIRATFAPPPGAGAFRVGLAAVGPGGRVLFDNIRVTLEGGAGSGRTRAVGNHRVSSTRQGILQIVMSGRRTLLNAHVRLESEADGVVSQAFAAEVEKSFKEDEITFTGRLMDPADPGAEIAFVERVQKADDGSSVVWTFPGDGLRAIDRVTLVVTLPPVDSIFDLPEPGQGTTEIICASGDGDFMIDYTGEVFLRTEKIGGRTRLTQTFPVSGGQDLEFGFRVRPTTNRKEPPATRAKKLVRDQNYARALEAYRQAQEQAKTARERTEFGREIRQLEDGEGRDWMKAVSAHIIWALSGSAEEETRARRAMDGYLKYWGDGKAFREKADRLVERTAEERAAAPSAEVERPRRVLVRAKAAAAAGQPAMAQVMLDALLKRWPESDAVKEAEELLQTLRQ